MTLAPLPQLPPRPHCLLIILWAEGHSVDFLSPDHTWVHTPTPQWNRDMTYSITLRKYRLTSAPSGVTLESLHTIINPRS